MPQKNAVVAVVTPARYAFLLDNPERVNVDAMVNQAEFERTIASLDLAAEHCHLIYDGGHGNADQNSGQPLQLNDQWFFEVEGQVRSLVDKGFSFKSIHLSSCFSASFIPLFRQLLTDEGVIFCQTLSSTASADKILSTAVIDDKDLFSIGFAVLASKVEKQYRIAGGHCFLSDSVYTREDDTLHRFRIDDPAEAFELHNFMIGARPHDKEHKGHLFSIESYLFNQGVSVDDRFICIDGLEEVVRNKSFPTTLRTISQSDIDKIQLLESEIFPGESPLALNECYNETYSWLVHEKHVPQKILSYIFITEARHNELFIHNLGTLPSARGKGFAHRLLQQVIKQADQSNKHLRLRVRANNAAALKLYEKVGFIVDGSASGDWLYMKRRIDRAFYSQPTAIDLAGNLKSAESLSDTTPKEPSASSLSSSHSDSDLPASKPKAQPSSDADHFVPEETSSWTPGDNVSSNVELNSSSSSSSFTESPKPTATCYGFLLKALTVSLSLCLLTAAAALFPPLGLSAGLGFVLTPMAGYAASGLTAALGGLGFFSAFKSEKEDVQSPANTPAM